MTTTLSVFGTIGSLGFVLSFVIDGATRPGYDPRRHAISALALGSRGWLQTTNFVVSGAFVTIGGLGLGTARAVALAVVVSVFGIGLLASGLFRMDPMRGYPPGTPDTTPEHTTAAHTRHDHAGAVVFVALPLAGFVAAVTAETLAWQLTSAAIGVWVAGWSMAFASAWEHDDPTTGRLQRVALAPGMVWLAATFAVVGW